MYQANFTTPKNWALAAAASLALCITSCQEEAPEPNLPSAPSSSASGTSSSMAGALAIDYDSQNNIFVAVTESNGQIDVYTGQHGNWSKLQENRDIDNRYSPANFAGFAIGDGDAMYGVAIGKDGTSINAREFYNKPWFGDGAPQQIGDLVAAYSVDYDTQNDIFVVVGANASGEIDVYTGQHGNWSKLQENRDIDNRYAASEFVDFAIGDGDAMYGVAIGTKNGEATSINAREFYNKPWFGDGAPRAIK